MQKKNSAEGLSPGERYLLQEHSPVVSSAWESQQKAVYGDKVPAEEKAARELPAVFVFLPVLLIILVLVLAGIQVNQWIGSRSAARADEPGIAERIQRGFENIFGEDEESEEPASADDKELSASAENNADAEEAGAGDAENGNAEEYAENNAEDLNRLRESILADDRYGCLTASLEEIRESWLDAGFSEEDILVSDEDDEMPTLVLSLINEKTSSMDMAFVMDDGDGRYLSSNTVDVMVLPEGISMGMDRQEVKDALKQKYAVAVDYEDETQAAVYREQEYYCFIFTDGQLTEYQYRFEK
ncbi:MAG: hypothetical protein Q4B22_01540 [Eubacteriales bacterium]|nr:hypothetical protein [Eubacteriales bacterium]